MESKLLFRILLILFEAGSWPFKVPPMAVIGRGPPGRRMGVGPQNSGSFSSLDTQQGNTAPKGSGSGHGSKDISQPWEGSIEKIKVTRGCEGRALAMSTTWYLVG